MYLKKCPKSTPDTSSLHLDLRPLQNSMCVVFGSLWIHIHRTTQSKLQVIQFIIQTMFFHGHHHPGTSTSNTLTQVELGQIPGEGFSNMQTRAKSCRKGCRDLMIFCLERIALEKSCTQRKSSTQSSRKRLPKLYPNLIKTTIKTPFLKQARWRVLRSTWI